MAWAGVLRVGLLAGVVWACDGAPTGGPTGREIAEPDPEGEDPGDDQGVVGPSEMPSELSMLAFDADVSTVGYAPTDLRAQVRVTNASSDPVPLEWGACSVYLRAYASSERSGRPLWRSERRMNPWSEHPYACLLYLKRAVLPAGDTLAAGEFDIRIPVYEVLGDSLPDGRYYFTLLARLNRLLTSPLTAGSADLSGAIEPVPSHREVAGIRFDSEVEPAAGADAFRLSVAARNLRDEPVVIAGAGNVTCPISLAGYTTPKRRDTWYLRRDADWGYRDRCLLGFPETTLGPGLDATFETVFNVAGPSEHRPIHLLAAVWLEIGGDYERILMAPGQIP